jgi:hypothetical protein
VRSVGGISSRKVSVHCRLVAGRGVGIGGRDWEWGRGGFMVGGL